MEHLNIWTEILNLCRHSVGKSQIDKVPTTEWKKRILLCEHSPIREITFKHTFENIKYWISVHFTRHKHGIEHVVTTQRTDRTGIDRDEKKQSETVNHYINANAQSIINISRKRLCTQAHKETRKEWIKFLKVVAKKEPELYSVCVPECIYRGFCPEFKCCGYEKRIGFKNALIEYRTKDVLSNYTKIR
jgi:hypothetical protein